MSVLSRIPSRPAWRQPTPVPTAGPASPAQQASEPEVTQACVGDPNSTRGVTLSKRFTGKISNQGEKFAVWVGFLSFKTREGHTTADLEKLLVFNMYL